jgi:hypothetical protein
MCNDLGISVFRVKAASVNPHGVSACIRAKLQHAALQRAVNEQADVIAIAYPSTRVVKMLEMLGFSGILYVDSAGCFTPKDFQRAALWQDVWQRCHSPDANLPFVVEWGHLYSHDSWSAISKRATPATAVSVKAFESRFAATLQQHINNGRKCTIVLNDVYHSLDFYAGLASGSLATLLWIGHSFDGDAGQLTTSTDEFAWVRNPERSSGECFAYGTEFTVCDVISYLSDLSDGTVYSHPDPSAFQALCTRVFNIGSHGIFLFTGMHEESSRVKEFCYTQWGLVHMQSANHLVSQFSGAKMAQWSVDKMDTHAHSLFLKSMSDSLHSLCNQEAVETGPLVLSRYCLSVLAKDDRFESSSSPSLKKAVAHLIGDEGQLLFERNEARDAVGKEKSWSAILASAAGATVEWIERNPRTALAFAGMGYLMFRTRRRAQQPAALASVSTPGIASAIVDTLKYGGDFLMEITSEVRADVKGLFSPEAFEAWESAAESVPVYGRLSALVGHAILSPLLEELVYKPIIGSFGFSRIGEAVIFGGLEACTKTACYFAQPNGLSLETQLGATAMAFGAHLSFALMPRKWAVVAHGMYNASVLSAVMFGPLFLNGGGGPSPAGASMLPFFYGRGESDHHEPELPSSPISYDVACEVPCFTVPWIRKNKHPVSPAFHVRFYKCATKLAASWFPGLVAGGIPLTKPSETREALQVTAINRVISPAINDLDIDRGWMIPLPVDQRLQRLVPNEEELRERWMDHIRKDGTALQRSRFRREQSNFEAGKVLTDSFKVNLMIKEDEFLLRRKQGAGEYKPRMIYVVPAAVNFRVGPYIWHYEQILKKVWDGTCGYPLPNGGMYYPIYAAGLTDKQLGEARSRIVLREGDYYHMFAGDDGNLFYKDPVTGVPLQVSSDYSGMDMSFKTVAWKHVFRFWLQLGIPAFVVNLIRKTCAAPMVAGRGDRRAVLIKHLRHCFRCRVFTDKSICSECEGRTEQGYHQCSGGSWTTSSTCIANAFVFYTVLSRLSTTDFTPSYVQEEAAKGGFVLTFEPRPVFLKGYFYPYRGDYRWVITPTRFLKLHCKRDPVQLYKRILNRNRVALTYENAMRVHVSAVARGYKPFAKSELMNNVLDHFISLSPVDEVVVRAPGNTVQHDVTLESSESVLEGLDDYYEELYPGWIKLAGLLLQIQTFPVVVRHDAWESLAADYL